MNIPEKTQQLIDTLLRERDEAREQVSHLLLEKAEAAIAFRDEIRRLTQQRDAAMVFVETIVHDVDVLSTRPAAAIKLNDLVARINEWGDEARKILFDNTKETTNGA